MITILRLGHRVGRDKRVTTHVALAARAFGAGRILVSANDARLEATVREVVRRFGGDFVIETGIPWQRTLREWPGPKVHLTMYGLPIDDVLPDIPKDGLLVVVGAEKVPAAVFRLVDWNVAVGNQPHSEVAAVAVFLDRLLRGEGLRRKLGGPLKIQPSARGKEVIEAEG